MHGQDPARGAPGTIDECMFKEDVQDQLNKFDKDLVSFIVTKKRVGPIRWLHGP